MKRRDFIRTTAIAAPAISMFPADLSSISTKETAGKIEKRSLGKTGEMLSKIGFGGILVMNETPETASASVKFAIDAGINYFDVAPTYGDAELKLGPALEPYRKNVFLACKTTQRSKNDSVAELEKSLKNMRTDHFDLYQFHAVTTIEDVEKIFAPGGAMETFQAAKEAGKIRFIGFSAHSVEAALAMMDNYDFDTILYPVNFVTWYAGNFGAQVLEKARQKNMGVLALKAMARGPWPKDADKSKYPKCWYEPLTTPEDIRMGLRFTLSHPVTAALTPGQMDLFKIALSQVEKLKPLKDKEIIAIKEMAMKGNPLFRFPKA
ncbi:MAG TPA: aldo/keto reductase [Bacteroidales bacterium]|nr:aldo/keto reductase [Bacteroidales bacterium]